MQSKSKFEDKSQDNLSSLIIGSYDLTGYEDLDPILGIYSIIIDIDYFYS